jgi:hypothetical protein
MHTPSSVGLHLLLAMITMVTDAGSPSVFVSRRGSAHALLGAWACCANSSGLTAPRTIDPDIDSRDPLLHPCGLFATGTGPRPTRDVDVRDSCPASDGPWQIEHPCCMNTYVHNKGHDSRTNRLFGQGSVQYSAEEGSPGCVATPGHFAGSWSMEGAFGWSVVVQEGVRHGTKR